MTVFGFAAWRMKQKWVKMWFNLIWVWEAQTNESSPLCEFEELKRVFSSVWVWGAQTNLLLCVSLRSSDKRFFAMRLLGCSWVWCQGVERLHNHFLFCWGWSTWHVLESWECLEFEFWLNPSWGRKDTALNDSAWNYVFTFQNLENSFFSLFWLMIDLVLKLKAYGPGVSVGLLQKHCSYWKMYTPCKIILIITHNALIRRRQNGAKSAGK